MFAIIPAFCFVLIYLIFYINSLRHNTSASWRSCFLLSSITCGVLLTAITELLSILNLVTFRGVLISWGLVCVVSILILTSLIYKIKPTIHFKAPEARPFEILLLCGIVFIVFAVGVIAFVAAPNQGDSMVYHMSRVAHWIQNHNVNHYPTHIERQLHRNPWAEFAIMHLQILNGGDRLANLIQWFSMIGSIIGVSLIAKLLGAGKKGQLFAAVVVATIPMGILQASNTQNDYVVSFWLVCFVYYIMLLKSRQSMLYSLLTGASLGLAMLTKPTAYIYSFPFLIWYSISAVRNPGNRYIFWKPVFIIMSIAVLINLGHYVRNIELYGAPLAQMEDESNKIFTLSSLVSSIIRNVSLHIGVPIGLINKVFKQGIEFMHHLFAININDPRTTFINPRFITTFNIVFALHDGSTGNLAHLILIIACSIFFFRSRRKKNERDLLYYPIILTFAFLLFCLFLKWTPWRSRLHLPLFVLWSPLIGVMLSRINANPCYRSKKLLSGMLVASFCLIGLWLAYRYFGHNLVEAMYNGKSLGFLNRIIARQAFIKPLGYYFERADIIFRQLFDISICFLLVLFLIYRLNLKMAHLMVFSLILLSLPWVFYTQYRKLLGSDNIFTVKRTDQYFLELPDIKYPYKVAANYIKTKGYVNIGLIVGADDWEYPFWVLLKGDNKTIRMEHVNVRNPSIVKSYVRPFNNFKPEAVIFIDFQLDSKIIKVKEMLSGQELVTRWSYP